MKIALIYPKSREIIEGFYTPSKVADISLSLYCKLTKTPIYSSGKRAFHILPYGILTLASLTPDSIDLSIIDERISEINFNIDCACNIVETRRNEYSSFSLF